MHISFEVDRHRSSMVRKWVPPKLPLRLAVVLARTGTLDGSATLVMADEMMAHAVADGLRAASPMISTAQVVPFGTRPEGTNAWFFMHHFPHAEVVELVGSDPAWLWVHNAGNWSPIELMTAASRSYTGVFHAGRIMAPRLGFRLFEHALEDEKVFRPPPNQKHDEAGVVFVGNAAMHVDLAPALIRLSHAARCNVYGHAWNLLGVPNLGRLPMSETPRALASATVCIDHVSRLHEEEGMTSTRMHQALACGAAVVSTQDPNLFPEEMRKHAVFVKGTDALVDETLRLYRDTAARCALRHEASASVRRYTIRRRCRALWEMMREDLAVKAL